MGERLLVLLVHLNGRKDGCMGSLAATNKTQCLQHVQSIWKVSLFICGSHVKSFLPFMGSDNPVF